MNTVENRMHPTTAAFEIASEFVTATIIGCDAIDPDDMGRLTVLAAGAIGIDLASAHGYRLDEIRTDDVIDAHYAMLFGLAERIVATGTSIFPPDLLVSFAELEAAAIVRTVFEYIEQLALTLDDYPDPENLTIEQMPVLTLDALKDLTLPLPSASPLARKIPRIEVATEAVIALAREAGFGGIAIDTREHVTCAATAIEIGPEPLMTEGTESFLEWASALRNEEQRRGWDVVARTAQIAVAKLESAESETSETATIDDPDLHDLVDRHWPAILAVEQYLPLSGLVSVDEVTQIIERSTT